MKDLDARFTLGSLLFSIGTAFIFNNLMYVNSFLWTFISIFLIFQGAYNTVKALFNKEKPGAGFPLSIFFIGILILLFEFFVLKYSITLLLTGIFASLGLGYILSGIFSKSLREITGGIIFAIISVFFFLPRVLNLPKSLYEFIRIYWLGIILIAIGVLIFLPKRGGKKE
jgi:uncharacterized membrane protein HdeD (DUF308 family)